MPHSAGDEFSALKNRTEQNLIEFLRVEADLASTFCTLAETTENPQHRAELLGNIRKAASAIRHFEPRIADPSAREELLQKADELDQFLAEISS
jgi:hypothetical protein